MNKYQEIIEYFGVRVINVLPPRNRKELSKVNAILILELVDRATPKKPKVISKPCGHLIFEEYRCPVCNAQMGRNNCCSNNECRQAIDWSKDDQ